MPFQSDSRCGTFMVQLNVNAIWGELESMLEKQYTKNIDEGSKFWLYVMELEFEYNCYLNSKTNPLPFWCWFIDNYNNIDVWSEIEDYFVDEDEEDSQRV